MALLDKNVNKLLAKIKIFLFSFPLVKTKLSLATLPSKKRIFTVLKSAHVHKKAREQFELKTYSKIISLNISLFKSPYLFFFNRFLYFCKSISTGIDCQIKYKVNK
jgi:hypothetical protein